MNTAIIVAGGSGTRMGDLKLPKQFTDVCGKPLIIWTLEKFNAHTEIDRIIVGCKAEYLEILKKLAAEWGISKLTDITPAGDTRQETVFNALNAVSSPKDDDIILIHDAVRPLVTDEIISENIYLAGLNGAVNTVVPSADTLAVSKDGVSIDSIPQRSELYQVQTPQTFKYGIIMKAHKNAVKNGVTNSTDDCRLVMDNGEKVFIAHGSRMNYKITTAEDLDLLRAFINAGEAGRNSCNNQ